MEEFKCKICGKCCKRMVEVMEILPHLADIIGEENISFPYSHNNGICEKLILENNHCSVFENRPVICRMEKLIELMSQKTNQDISIIRKIMYSESKKFCEGT
ncbi:MAG: YkgJ family cysteine cluster protein [Dysgonomonas mossii]|uniref:YkgJ family cysteine cluster protein n=1 Tax=Dysgonomonas mossii TaxID=163665 RepID=UPI0026EA5C6F|nr:YkgJ family cysteine cluster protein [Dysgonomonas mossii]MBS5907490.1 YkgJ family cysteine cluster protein [Dysgonomonas mossii]